MTTVEQAVGLSPKEAIAFLRQKTNQTTERWTDVWNEAHSRAFSVAGAASEALVQDFRAAVAKAIEGGTTLAAFRADFDGIVAKHGWVHNGSAAWRSQIIYETNLSTAYSAGRYAQMTEPDVLEAFPFWRYQHNAAIHPRQQHLDWSGLVLRADDGWWATHYPPNGWRCHCSVSPVSEGGMRRMGRTGPDKAPPLDLRKVSIRTGEGYRVAEVPRGIDPSFAYNPGQAWLERADRPVVGQMPARPAARPSPVHVDPLTDLAPIAQRAPLRAEAVGAPTPLPRPPATLEQLQRFLADPVGSVPIGTLHPELAAAIQSKQRELLLSADTVEKQREHHPDLTAQDYAAVARMVAAPQLVVADRGRHVVLVHYAGKLMKAVVKGTHDGAEAYLVSLTRFNEASIPAVLRRGRAVLGSLLRLRAAMKRQ